MIHKLKKEILYILKIIVLWLLYYLSKNKSLVNPKLEIYFKWTKIYQRQSMENLLIKKKNFHFENRYSIINKDYITGCVPYELKNTVII